MSGQHAPVDHLLRACAPEVLAALVRRHGRFDECEDAVQEALVAATRQWPRDGTPDRPAAWLTTVASRRLVDRARGEHARRAREARAVREEPRPGVDDAADRADPVEAGDDVLVLFLLCAHPALTASSQVALTLRAVGGLTTAEIARAFLVPEATMAQRISRAKQTIRHAGATFAMPEPDEAGARVAAACHALYLVFNEGYVASAGEALQRVDLAHEAIRLARALAARRPDDPEVAGLLALLLLTHARSAARTTPDGRLVPLAMQDRTRWDRSLVREGVAILERVLPRGEVGPYQLQAAIAAVHDEAASDDATDWPQVLALYGLLAHVAPSPVVTLNGIVAHAMVHGPDAGLALLDACDADERATTGHRHDSVRAHLLERAGRTAEAREAYRVAARRTTSTPERRHLLARASALD